jgi:hypothetical protein
MATTTTTRTPEETRALALERVDAHLAAGWYDLGSPMLGGLGDQDQDVRDEIFRITGVIQAESKAAPTPARAWQACMGGSITESWWLSVEYGEEGTTWEKPGTLIVTVEDPMGYRPITKTFTALDLLHTYQQMKHKTHCGGCDVVGDPDACSFDLILQWAFFGELVYG